MSPPIVSMTLDGSIVASSDGSFQFKTCLSASLPFPFDLLLSDEPQAVRAIAADATATPAVNVFFQFICRFSLSFKTHLVKIVLNYITNSLSLQYHFVIFF